MNIQTTTEIAEALDAKYMELISWLDAYPESDLNLEKVAGKWTAAQQIDHLNRSTKPVNQGLRMPKLGLRTMFGTNNRKEKNFDEMVAKYQKVLEGEIPFIARYQPKQEKVFIKEELKSRLTSELEEMKSILKKWNEKGASKYLLPHPVMGKLTVREMMFFTIYHTEHHFKQLQENY